MPPHGQRRNDYLPLGLPLFLTIKNAYWQTFLLAALLSSFPIGAHSQTPRADYSPWTGTQASLQHVLVYVKDSPKDTEELRQHHLFHNLLAGFGFMNNSPLFPDSTFGSNNAFDLRLSPLDIQMISFCYRHVPPASLSSDVSKHLKLSWGK